MKKRRKEPLRYIDPEDPLIQALEREEVRDALWRALFPRPAARADARAQTEDPAADAERP